MWMERMPAKFRSSLSHGGGSWRKMPSPTRRFCAGADPPPLGRLAVLPAARFCHAGCVLLAFLGLHSTSRPALASSLPSTILAIMSSSAKISAVSASLHVRGRATALFAGPGAHLPRACRGSLALPAFANDAKQLLRLADTGLIQYGHHGPATYLAYISIQAKSLGGACRLGWARRPREACRRRGRPGCW